MNNTATQRKVPLKIVEAQDLSSYLVHHEGLMTPMLKRYFGPFYVDKIFQNDTDSYYSRSVALRQNGSHLVLLSAELCVFKSVVPEQMIEALRNSATPFGELLIHHGIDVIIRQQTFSSQSEDLDQQGFRQGRRRIMLESTHNSLVCLVDELLSPEDTLQQAKTYYQKKRIS